VDGFAPPDLQQAKIQEKHATIFCGYCLQNCGHPHYCVWSKQFDTIFS
jgi:hypothetical protein